MNAILGDFVFWKMFPLVFLLSISLCLGMSQGDGNDAPPQKVFNSNVKILPVVSRVERSADTSLGINGLQHKTTVINAEFGQHYNGIVNMTSPMIFIYSYNETNMTTPARISVSCNKSVTSDYPVLFVARQQRGVLAWRIPFNMIDGYPKWAVSRTLCRRYGPKNPPRNDQQISLEVSTMATRNVSFNLTAEQLDDFEIRMNQQRKAMVASSMPVYFMFHFPDNVEAILLEVRSPDSVCMSVSLQSVKCPVMDSDYNVEYRGKYQTMTTRAALHLERERNYYKKPDYYGFYLVFVVKANDEACTGERRANQSLQERRKTITFQIREAVPATCERLDPPLALGRQYVIATIVAVVVFLSIYGVSILVGVIYTKCGWGMSLDDMFYSGGDNGVGDVPQVASNEGFEASGEELDEVDTGSRLEPSSTPLNPDLRKMAEKVSDLSQKKYSHQEKSYKLYLWNLSTISVFYALPAIQLVLTHHQKLKDTGEEDLCYFNFDCANPLTGFITSFNNVFSNIGYILLGILFIAIVYWRKRRHNGILERHQKLERFYSIPQYYGLDYAMGLALITEGVMSALYHVCPSHSNFQFDTSFMYIMACLCMLKMYQTRHPDVTVRAHIVYISMALIILVAVLNIIFEDNIFWIVYGLVQMTFSLVLTASIYSVGTWKINHATFTKDTLLNLICCKCCGKPEHKDRFILLLLANLWSWGWFFKGAITHGDAFTTLLFIFVGNMAIYCAAYITMKLKNKEYMNPGVYIVIVLSLVTWTFALYFFTGKLTHKESTPAVSRQGNRDCLLLSFYDAHDIWHFLSAISLFLSFLLLTILNDDLRQKRRDEIPVF